MSNHSGSYMLNEVIEILDRHQVFAGIEKTTTQTLIKEILLMATNKYDCNQGEILEGYAQQFNLCYYTPAPMMPIWMMDFVSHV
jgi:hypothetical protein